MRTANVITSLAVLCIQTFAFKIQIASAARGKTHAAGARHERTAHCACRSDPTIDTNKLVIRNHGAFAMTGGFPHRGDASSNGPHAPGRAWPAENAFDAAAHSFAHSLVHSFARWWMNVLIRLAALVRMTAQTVRALRLTTGATAIGALA